MISFPCLPRNADGSIAHCRQRLKINVAKTKMRRSKRVRSSGGGAAPASSAPGRLVPTGGCGPPTVPRASSKGRKGRARIGAADNGLAARGVTHVGVAHTRGVGEGQGGEDFELVKGREGREGRKLVMARAWPRLPRISRAAL
jgi:hypothetical protein